jgi:hypothetical protein
MQKETLIKILERAPGLDKDGDCYRTRDGHNIAFYLGEPGNAMVIGGVQRVTLLPEYLEINAKPSTTLYVTHETIHALAVKQEDDSKVSRAGVGF